MNGFNLLKKCKSTILVAAIILVIAPSAFAEEDTTVYRLKDIVVVADKYPSPVQEIPSSITAFDSDAIEDAGIDMIGDAAIYIPNINLVEFSERVLSQPYFRGIGSGPGNPAVTAYLDGVPQLHGYSANIEFMDVGQIEFLRGAQGALYGRNTVGGVIHILSRPPDLSSWEYSMEAEYGSYDLMRGNLRISGPFIKEKSGMSIAAGYASRDGFSENDITGNDIDSREAFFGKLQLEWLFTDTLSARLLLFAEKDRDGDYALHDLAALRANPYHGQRDFEGFLDRDIFSQTFIMEYTGKKVDFKSITGLVRWDTDGVTDLDYTPYPAMLRGSGIKGEQMSQEIQWRSAEDAPVALNDNINLTWQAGALFFTQEYRETSINRISQPFPLELTSPLARLDDNGFGAYTRVNITSGDLWDAGFGLRFDYEDKDADLRTFYTPALPQLPSSTLNADRDFTEISPHFSLIRRLAPGKMLYGTISRGYRAGGFNPVSPSGYETYDEETSWNYEAGLKTTWFEELLKINLASFYISWDHMQLNLPYMQTYYIANAGKAESAGVEIEISARPFSNLEVYGAIGYNRAKFGDGSRSIHTNADGTNTEEPIGGKDLIFTPDFTASLWARYSWDIGPDSELFIRAEINGYGRYFYNTANTESQGSYWLSGFRAGYKGATWVAEAWVKNLFDKEYIPVAFEFPNGQSGFVGENGAPCMYGLRTGFSF